MGRKVKGSYTVEMALLSGIWLLTVFAGLLLLLGGYQKVWDTAGACETAVYGSTMAVCRQIDGVRKAKETEKVKADEYHVSGSKREITVSFDKTWKLPFGTLYWRRHAAVKSKVIRPVLFIEKVQKSRRVLGKAADA